MPPLRQMIAIIDDDESVRRALERLLRLAGYRCAIFSSAEDFVAVAASLGAACVLADIQLTGMSGLHLALHPIVTELELPVVLMSGSTDPLVETPAREFGAAFLRKPISADTLLETIVDTAGPPIGEGIH
jgi:FixJ family two-component response regulator